MKKYKRKLNGEIAIIISQKGAGMGWTSIGTTYVIYRYEQDDIDCFLVMEHVEFYNKHSEIK